MTSSCSASVPLHVEKVTKRFRQGETRIEALCDVSLSIQRGEFVAVMGSSGSGKSTLLHVIAGLTRPDTGSVLVDGHDLGTMGDGPLTRFRRRQIGLVFQAFNLIPTLSARDNILLPLWAESRRDAYEGRLDDLVTRLGLRDRLRHRPDALSGGEQQRVAIARALIAQPSLLLADEPTGSLDSVSGQSLCRLLRQLCEDERRTIVLVTHEPAVAIWAERIVILKDGRLLSEFATREVHDAHHLAARYQEMVSTAEVRG